MFSMGSRAAVATVCIGMLAAMPMAFANEPAVEVSCEVVLASNNGNVIDPPSLNKMKDQFSKSGLSFTSYKRLSEHTVQLKGKTPSDLNLPNGKVATFKLDELKGGSATVRVDVPNLVGTSLKLGRQGSVFLKVGEHEGGTLVLVVAPKGK
jgi:hypothetical protein